MLQTRTPSARTIASLRMAATRSRAASSARDEALGRLSASMSTPSPPACAIDKPPSQAIPAGTGVATGPAAFSVRPAQAFAERGTPAIWCATDVPPATSRYRRRQRRADAPVTHLARRRGRAPDGKVCLVGCADLHIDEAANQATLGQTVISEGDPLCLDGDAGTIYADSPQIVTERPDALSACVQSWRTSARIAQ